jgi:hypothetical protein
MTTATPRAKSSIGPWVTGRDGLARRERRAAAAERPAADAELPERRAAPPPDPLPLAPLFLAPLPLPLAADAPEAAFF